MVYAEKKNRNFATSASDDGIIKLSMKMPDGGVIGRSAFALWFKIQETGSHFLSARVVSTSTVIALGCDENISSLTVASAGMEIQNAVIFGVWRRARRMYLRRRVCH